MRVQERCDVGPSSDGPAVEAASGPCTTILLIRHAHTDAIGTRLCGRLPGIPLSAAGYAQATRLGRRLGRAVQLNAIYSSPLERARATASALARYQNTPVHAHDDLSEIDFGDWAGKTFAELEADPAWREFNRSRASATIPGGERPAAVQNRIVSAIARLAATHSGGTIAIVSHGDVIRFALLHYHSMPLDLYYCLEVEPGSLSAVRLSGAGAQVLYVNDGKFAAPRRSAQVPYTGSG